MSLPVFLASLSANLEPIYSIFVAFVFLGECHLLGSVFLEA